MLLKDKKIVLGVTASVAIYKALEVVRVLMKEGAEVRVVMTQNATKLVNPQLFKAVSGQPVLYRMFSKRSATFPHLDLVRETDLILICPATANMIGKMAQGVADDLLSTLVLSYEGKVVVAPAMNTRLWRQKIVQANVSSLRKAGFRIVGPEKGRLACGDEGLGRLAGLDSILDEVIFNLYQQDLKGKRILVTAGPTREPVDPVRFWSNYSSGKMGYAIARIANLRGAKVTLVSGPTNLECPKGVSLILVETAEEMLQAVGREFARCDVFISAAAVCDFRSVKVRRRKIVKSVGSGDSTCDLAVPRGSAVAPRDLTKIDLKRNPDILLEMAKRKNKLQRLVGFSLQDSLQERERARQKFERKKLDLLVINTVDSFGGDEMEAVLMTGKGVRQISERSKEVVAGEILDFCRGFFL